MEEAVQRLVGVTANRTRRGIVGMRSVVLGLYTTQGVGVTRASMHPTARTLLHLVHKAAKEIHQPYFAVAINYLPAGAELREHTDQRNWSGALSSVYSFGEYTGGELWQRGESQCDSWQSGERRKWLTIDPNLPHGVSRVKTGARWSIILFTPGRLDQVPQNVWQCLRALGFPSRHRLAQRLYHRFSQGLWCLVQGIDRQLPELDPTMMKNWGYTRDKDQYVLTQWTDVAEADGPGDNAAEVQCLPRQDKADVIVGVHVLKQLLHRRPVENEDTAFDLVPDEGENIDLLREEEIQSFLDSVEMQDVSASVEKDLLVETHEDLASVEKELLVEMHEDLATGENECHVEKRDVCALAENFPGVDMAEVDDEDALDENEDETNQWTPSATELKAIHHVHSNLGHPTNVQLARMLKHAGARHEVARWVRKHFSCDACKRLARPANHLPAKHPATFATNQIMSMDTIFVKYQGEELAIVHAIDWGTSYVQARVLSAKTAKETFKFWCQAWVSVLGVPKIVVTDAGTEYTGEEFRVGDLGAHHYVTDAKSPWQNGRCERSGKELKRQLEYVMEETQPVDREDFENCVAQVVLVKNQYTSHAGFTPLQRLFGYAPEVPEVLTQAARRSPLLWEGPQEAIQRAEHVRECAVQAWVKSESRARLLKASRSQHRVPLPPLQVGQHVRVWRQPPYSKGQWIGPAQVLAVTPSGAYLSVRGVLWKVSRVNIRSATEEEEMASTMVERFVADLKAQTRPGIKRFLDCTRDPVPPIEQDEKEDEREPDQRGQSAGSGSGDVRTSSSGGELVLGPRVVEPSADPNAPSEGGSDIVQPMALDRQETISEPDAEGHHVPGARLSNEEGSQFNPVQENAELEDGIPVPGPEPETPVPHSGVRRARGSDVEEVEPQPRRARVQGFPYPFDRYEGPFLQEETETKDDWWEEKEDRWVRHHAVSRRKLYQPEALGGQTIDNLSGERLTLVCALATGRWSTHRDYWDAEKEGDEKVLPFHWTGETHFFKKDLDVAVWVNAKPGLYTPCKGIVHVKQIPPEYGRLFYEGARRKEANAIRPSITPVPPEEAIRIQREAPQRVMTTRWLDTWKEVDESEDAVKTPHLNIPGNLQSKSRWIIKGYSDPDYASMQTDSPTPELAEIQLCFQVHCSLGWTSMIGDIKAAFNQSNMNMRAEPVYAWVPEGGLPADDPLPTGTSMVRLDREVYGLLIGPAALRRTILEFLKEDGWMRHPLAPCVFTQYDIKGKLIAMLLLLVDDILVAGEGEVYQGKIESLQKRFHWGKRETLTEGTALLYAGREVRKHADGSVSLDISGYVHRIEKIEVARGRERNAEADSRDVTEFRRLLGAMLWAGRAGCSQILGSLSLLASRTSTLKVEDLHEANRVLQSAKKMVCAVRVQPIALDRMVWIAWSDASMGNASGHRSQAGYVLALADRDVLKYVAVPATVVMCQSHKLARVAGSSLMAETLALSETLAAVEYWQKWLGYTLHPGEVGRTELDEWGDFVQWPDDQIKGDRQEIRSERTEICDLYRQQGAT
eukprot:1176592-Amphidinium_carterae.2